MTFEVKAVDMGVDQDLTMTFSLPGKGSDQENSR